MKKMILIKGVDVDDIRHSIIKTGVECNLISKSGGFFSEKEIIYEIVGEEKLVSEVISGLDKLCKDWEDSSPFVNSVRASMKVIN